MAKIKSRRKKISKRRRGNPTEKSLKPRFVERIPLVGRFFQKAYPPGVFRVKGGYIIIKSKFPGALGAKITEISGALGGEEEIYFSPDGTTKYLINVEEPELTAEQKEYIQMQRARRGMYG